MLSALAVAAVVAAVGVATQAGGSRRLQRRRLPGGRPRCIRQRPGSGGRRAACRPAAMERARSGSRGGSAELRRLASGCRGSPASGRRRYSARSPSRATTSRLRGCCSTVRRGRRAGTPRLPCGSTAITTSSSESEVRDAESQGVYLDGADDVRLVGNHIHDNGDKDDPAVANLHHGIYFKSGSGVIARQPDRAELLVRRAPVPVAARRAGHQQHRGRERPSRRDHRGRARRAAPGEQPRRGQRPHLERRHGRSRASARSAFGNVVEDNVYWANGTAGSTTGLVTRRNVERNPGLRRLHISPR